MTVYIEYVIADNFIFTFLIAKACCLFSGDARNLRCVTTSIIGTIASIYYPFLAKELLIAIKALLFIILTMTLFRFHRGFLRNSAMFLFFTALLGGIQFFIGFLILGSAELALRVPVSTNMPLSFYVFPLIGFSVAIRRFIKYLRCRRRLNALSYEAKVSLADAEVLATGFLDTGNTLTFKNKEVALLSISKAAKLFELGLSEDETDMIDASTPGGEVSILILKKAKLSLYLCGQEHIIDSVQVGVSDLCGKVELLLPQGIMDIKE